ncbi:Homeobox-like_domain superfamily [Hexamita inflata]|uniref:Homeobox-like domain superfamily n=1 Tax=Hexamita inflata TaxID=28002 RepID=A0AA86Q4A7_9EUKA|nr:Homeobox-like domain superfamily [Hexamita inflata]
MTVHTRSRRITIQERCIMMKMWETGPQTVATKKQIASCLQCSLQTVYSILKHLEVTGKLEASHADNSIKKFDQAEIFALVNVAKANRFESRRVIAEKYYALRGISMSLTTVSRLLAKFSLLSHYVVKSQELKEFTFDW